MMRSCAAVLIICSTAASAQALRASFTFETPPVPGNQAGDTALLRDRYELGRDVVFGTDTVNPGFYSFFTDGGSGPILFLGPVGGVDAMPAFETLPNVSVGGLVAASASTQGNVVFFAPLRDGGFGSVSVSRPIATTNPKSLALAEFGDAGAHVFVTNDAALLLRWELIERAGRLDAVVNNAIVLPSPAQAVAVSSGLRRVYASVGIGGVVEIDPLSPVPTVVNVIDAGSSAEIATGLAVYPQGDGGAVLITSVAARDLFRFYSVRQGVPAVHLADFLFTAPDGGRQVRGAEFLDVTPGAFGGTAANPVFDAGVLVVCDRLSVGGANYKLIPWDTIARAATPQLPIDVPVPPPVPIRPIDRLPFVIATKPEPSSTAAVAFWPGRDSLFATFESLSALSVVDLTKQFSVSAAVDGGIDGGAALVGGVDAVAGLTLTGLVAMTSVSDDAGTLTFFSGAPDGGLLLLETTSIPAEQAGAVAVLDFGNNSGVAAVAGAQQALHRFELSETDAGLVVMPMSDLPLPAAATSVIASRSANVFFVAAGDEGVLEVEPFNGGVRHLIDAGSAPDTVAGLAQYPQVDGGMLLLTSVPAKDLFRVYRVRPEPTTLLAEFQVTTPGGTLVPGLEWLDVSVDSLGRTDGGARWPSGVLAIGTARDGGTVHLIGWDTVAQAADPPLPVDVRFIGSGAGGGGAGGGARAGGAGGGGTGGPRAGGRTGGGGVIDETPSRGCCSGAPSASVLPALGFLYWLRRFGRRRLT
jgi:myo-inositol-hexaphosphate 3-phosphohydrolase